MTGKKFNKIYFLSINQDTRLPTEKENKRSSVFLMVFDEPFEIVEIFS